MADTKDTDREELYKLLAWARETEGRIAEVESDLTHQRLAQAGHEAVNSAWREIARGNRENLSQQEKINRLLEALLAMLKKSVASHNPKPPITPSWTLAVGEGLMRDFDEGIAKGKAMKSDKFIEEAKALIKSLESKGYDTAEVGHVLEVAERLRTWEHQLEYYSKPSRAGAGKGEKPE